MTTVRFLFSGILNMINNLFVGKLIMTIFLANYSINIIGKIKRKLIR